MTVSWPEQTCPISSVWQRLSTERCSVAAITSGIWLTCAFPPPVDFETFSKILNRPGGFRDPGDIDEYCRGFEVFDQNRTGFIAVGQFKYIMTQLGDHLDEDEVAQVLNTVDTSNGEVPYRGAHTFRLFQTPSPSHFLSVRR